MHHDLDIYPVPELPFYINEPGLIDSSLGYYDPERKIPADELKDYKKALKDSNFEKARWFNRFPEASDDNIRVYIPLDLNENAILRRLGEIIGRYGEASEYNESEYSSEVNKVISQLEIYDQMWYCRELKDGTSHFVGLDTEHDKSEEHSQHGLELVKKLIKRLENIPDACAEMFPFSTIDELNMEWFGIETHTEPK